LSDYAKEPGVTFTVSSCRAAPSAAPPIALPLPLLAALEWHGARVKRLKCVGMGLNQGVWGFFFAWQCMCDSQATQS